MDPFETLNSTMLEIEHIFNNTMDGEYHQAPYAKFLLLAPILEFIGAFYDDEPFSSRKKGIGKQRTEVAVKRHLPKYLGIELYRNYRCGMLHRLSPAGNLDLITTRDIKSEKRYLKKSHLAGITIEGHQLRIIVLEELFKDLMKANRDIQATKNEILLNRMDDKSSLKLRELEGEYLRV